MSFPIPIMLTSAIVVDDSLFVTGGVTGSMEKPVVSDAIYKYNSTLLRWELWARMSHGRLNHDTARYGSLLIVVGGHTMRNMIPEEIPSATCYDTRSPAEDRSEYTTPSLGSNKIGLCVGMMGDPRMIRDHRSDTKGIKDNRSSSTKN